MAEKLQIYKCNTCGNIVEVLHEGVGEMACCGKLMTRLDEKTADAATEKHVPVIEKIDGGIKVTVGSVPFPILWKKNTLLNGLSCWLMARPIDSSWSRGRHPRLYSMSRLIPSAQESIAIFTVCGKDKK
jgi:desulfoferrodoxin-like iron-binding protein